MDENIEISIISPVYNESDNIEIFINKVFQVMGESSRNWELVMIDDGSTDGSRDILKKLSKEKPELRALLLSKNFGQTPAIQAGFDKAKGKYFVTLDSDLQNDPKDIPRVLNKLIDEELDLVVGWRKNRKDNFFLRNFPSMIANTLIGIITGVRLNDCSCSLKAYNASILKSRLYSEIMVHSNLDGYKNYQKN